MISTDITNTIEQLLDMIIINIQRCWNIIGNITIWDINLLQWFTTIFILSIVIPIIFTIVKSGSATGTKAIRNGINKRK